MNMCICSSFCSMCVGVRVCLHAPQLSGQVNDVVAQAQHHWHNNEIIAVLQSQVMLRQGLFAEPRTGFQSHVPTWLCMSACGHTLTLHGTPRLKFSRHCGVVLVCCVVWHLCVCAYVLLVCSVSGWCGACCLLLLMAVSTTIHMRTFAIRGPVRRPWAHLMSDGKQTNKRVSNPSQERQKVMLDDCTCTGSLLQ